MKIWIGLLLWLVLSMAAGWVGSQFSPGEWYASLSKPSWNPPGAVFAPVWTFLYILMGIAAWLVWREKGFAGNRTVLLVFVVQLVLNGLWSYLFFGLHNPLAAFIEILVLWLLILITLVLFWRVRSLAGVLLIPYLAWVAFASVLNFTLWRLNV